ncbi:uncharacterized protein LOC117645883 [Thrips palmi]|uniref:Uncharacterized protein LOC117645883 n=1 Tax=Thrips palmi TaxID=161013 RepID=A0A6P8YXI7_THRPL|nr:uncharacterized protein LOC117645883 [Thrips palmi]
MSSRSSNGSVITLTMHNNHLIVEKEEIVESEFGPEDHMYDEALATPQLYAPSLPPPPPATAYSDQKAIVHQPPATATTPALTKGAETGLSQPDLSTGSDGNPPYSYGNQVGYDAGPLGYAAYNGYRVDEPPSRHRHVAPPSPRPAPPPDVVAVVPLRVQDSIDGQDGIQDLPEDPPEDLPEDSPQPQRLMSDIQARHDALQHHGEGVPNGGPAVDIVAVDAADDGDDDSASVTEDACSVKAQSPLPPRALALGLVSGATAADQPLRSPVVDKLRLEEATPIAELERFPLPSPGHGTRTPPKSPLASAAKKAEVP